MSFYEIDNKVNQVSSAWEELKSINDRCLKEEAQNGAADPLTINQRHNLNQELTNRQEQLKALQRPMVESNYMEPHHLQMHRKAFINYIRKGVETDLLTLEQKALSSTTENSGGFMISTNMNEQVMNKLQELSPMRKICQVTQISGDTLELIEDRLDAMADWAGDGSDYDKAQPVQLNKKIIPTHELFAQPKATQKMIDDISIDMESWLANKVIDAFTRKENAAFINGDGVGKPRGILSYEDGTSWGKIEQIKSEESREIIADDLFNLFYSLKEIYAVQAKFLMSRDAIQAVRMLKNGSSGHYLWSPGLAAGAPDTLLGAEVIQSADMPTIGQGGIAIAYADFSKAYQIVDRQGVRILRDPFTNKPYVKFYTTKRVGGDVVDFEAIKLLKISA